MRSSLCDIMKKIRKHSKKMGSKKRTVDELTKYLSGHEKLKTPMLDKALHRLRGHEKISNHTIDEAYKYLAGTRKKMKA